jgi:tetratricopeptide (TPR) repeat protein
MLQKKPFEKALQEANEASPDFVFPSRRLDLEVFMWTMLKGPQWKPLYYFAMLLKSKNTDEEAIIKLFDAFTAENARQQGVVIDYAPFYATRSKIYASKFPEKAIADLQKAISLDKEGWRYYKSLTELYNQQKQYKEALKTIEPFYLAHPQQYIIGMLYAKTLLFNNQYAAADKLLTGLQIIPFEGSTQGHELYRQAKLMQALESIEKNENSKAIILVNQAKEWPENLGAGKPYDADIDTSLENKILAAAKQKPIPKDINALKELLLKK